MKNYIRKNIRIIFSVEKIARIKIQKGIDMIQVIIYMESK